MYKSERLAVRTIAARTALGRDKILEVLRAADVPLRGRGARTAERLDADQVRRAYEGGASLRGLARAGRTDEGVIRETLLGAGVPVRRQGRISKWQDVLTASFLRQKYIEEQQSLSDIAQQVGCSYQTVLDAVHRHGIAVRGGRSRAGQSR
jgi:hypothetical protein